MRRHATTIRFDADTWALLGDEAQRLGVARAEIVRNAVLLRLGEQRACHRVFLVENRLDQLAGQVRTLARAITRLGLVRSEG